MSAGVEAFLYREARLLDERRFEEWRALFADDGLYWAPSRPDQADPDHEVSLFHDDVPMLEARIRRLRHPRIHAELPHTRTVHALSNIEPLGERDGLVHVAAVFSMTELREDRQTFYTGRARWELRAAGDDYRIKLKRVDLLNADAMHQMMTIPF
jgi:benzoate/toluate 1,2-dioxygenase beta subunit